MLGWTQPGIIPQKYCHMGNTKPLLGAGPIKNLEQIDPHQGRSTLDVTRMGYLILQHWFLVCLYAAYVGNILSGQYCSTFSWWIYELEKQHDALTDWHVYVNSAKPNLHRISTLHLVALLTTLVVPSVWSTCHQTSLAGLSFKASLLQQNQASAVDTMTTSSY